MNDVKSHPLSLSLGIVRLRISQQTNNWGHYYDLFPPLALAFLRHSARYRATILLEVEGFGYPES